MLLFHRSTTHKEVFIESIHTHSKLPPYISRPHFLTAVDQDYFELCIAKTINTESITKILWLRIGIAPSYQCTVK